MSDFTHLHVHSHYSLLDGLSKVESLVAKAKELGMNSLAITDHGVMYGAIEFFQTAQKAGVKPIIGVEVYVAPKGHTNKRGRIDADPRHLTLLAQNNAGYQHLITLTTQAHLKGFYYKPRIDYELLEQHSEGLVVLSGCINGDIPQAILSRNKDEVARLIEWHVATFGRERFYFEVQHHPTLREQNIINEALFDLSKKYNVGLVATADSHYLLSTDAEAQDVLICVQTGKKVQDKDRLSMLGEDFSLKGPDELKELWKDHPEAIDNTQRIAEQCNVELSFGKNYLPHYPLPAGTTADQELKKLSEAGLQRRFGEHVPTAAPERLQYELEVIAKTGFASYFLIVADFVNEAKRRGILVGPGRGSAAGSLVSYLTNITNIDPLQYDLLFERFLNPERVSMPDIDLDFADDRRDEVIAYVREKYGTDHVAQIITFGTMAARAAVRDAGRALGFPYAFCDQIAKAIPPFMDFEEALKQSSELKELYTNDPQAQRLVDTAKKLEGVCRHASTHAAGIVITEQPLTHHVPLQLANTSSSEQDVVTQYAMKEVEALGLLKMDFLGLKNLTIIQNTLQRVQKRTNQLIDIDRLPLDDALSYQLLQTGTSTGVFQLESSGMKRYLKELKPTEFEDIISMVALYRPGPMDSIPDFIASKHGKRKVTYLHPLLEPILAKTYGVIVTQDQVLEIARRFAGFSYAEADILRKAVGKKIKELLDEQREKFVQGAITTNNVSKKTAQQVWDFIEPFARYGFNRAHAACYAMIAFQTAYLKAHYPAEFMAAMLTSDQGNIDRAAIEVAEALSMGLTIQPPDINESEHDFTVVETGEGKFGIRFGLAGVKNVGDVAVTRLIEERTRNGPFKDLADLFRRIDSKSFNRKTAESLTSTGALDRLGERGYILHNLETLLTFNRELHRTLDAGQKNLFGGTAAPLALPEPKLEPATPAERGQRLQWEKELLGMYVSEHPLSELWPVLKDKVLPMVELKQMKTGTVKVAGVISRITKIITKSQQPMLFVLMEDLVANVEVLVFPSLLKTTAEQWRDGAIVVVEGKLSDKDGETKVLADKIRPLNKETIAQLRAHGMRSSRQATRILIRLPHSSSKEQLTALQQTLKELHTAEGLPVELMVTSQGSVQSIRTSYRVVRSDSLQQLVSRLVGAAAVTYT